MKKIIGILLFCAMIIFISACGNLKVLENNSPDKPFDDFWNKDNSEFVEGTLLIGYNDKEDAVELIESIGGTVVDEIQELKVLKVDFEEEISSVKKGFNEKYNVDPSLFNSIRYFERDYKRELIRDEIVTLDDLELNISDFVSQDSPRSIPDLMKYVWGIDKIKSPQAWANGFTGEGVIVAVVDTGVDMTHPDLVDNSIGGYAPFTNEVLLPGFDHSQTQNHGTHCAGTIAASNDGHGVTGVAPDANIMNIRIFDDNAGPGGAHVGDFYTAKGMIWAVNNGADVLSNSWGGGTYSFLINDAFAYAINNGVVCVKSSGNDHSAKFTGSAFYKGLINVGAIDFKNSIKFATRGEWVSVVAPGQSILSTLPVARTGAYTYDQPYVFMRGTSMACPHVAGLSALMVQKAKQDTSSQRALGIHTVYQIRKAIEKSAVDICSAGFDIDSGWGVVDAAAATAYDLNTLEEGANVDFAFKTSRKIAAGTFEYLEDFKGVFLTLVPKADNVPELYGRSNNNGVAKFNGIEPGDYDLYYGVADPYAPAGVWDSILSHEKDSAVFYGVKDTLSIPNGSTTKNYVLSNELDIVIENATFTGTPGNIEIISLEGFSGATETIATISANAILQALNLSGECVISIPANVAAGLHLIGVAANAVATDIAGVIRYKNSEKEIKYITQPIVGNVNFVQTLGNRMYPLF